MVRWLRRDLDEFLGPGAGHQLVVHCAKSTYQLAILADAIVIVPNVKELAPYHLPQVIVDDLLKHAAEAAQPVSALSAALV
jgi:hypothetical protein